MHKSKVVNIIKSKSGISLVLVLAVTLLLLAIGASTLVAANAAAGANASQIAYKQMELYTDSVVKTLTYNLQHSNPTDDQEKSLAGQLIFAMYNEKDSKIVHEGTSHAKTGLLLPTKMEVALVTVPSVSTSITISAVTLNVIITPEIPAKDEKKDGLVVISPGTEREPEKATVNARIEITMNLLNKDKKMASIATYEYTGGYLLDGVIKNSGNWRLVEYERID